MGGGTLQIESVGRENLVFMGNPQVTFFKKVFKRYANFGIEKIKISPNQNTDINLSQDTILTYNVERYGDLTLDMYFSIDLPNIWSPIYSNNNQLYANNIRLDSRYSTEGKQNQIWSIPYEFKWIKNLGAHIIKNIKIKIDDQIIQDYSGDYILSIAERDLPTEKKKLFSEMIGNSNKFNEPGAYLNRNGNYPSACYFSEKVINKDNNINNLNKLGLEPSIRGETLYIPLNNWSMLDPTQAIPLISMQSSKVTVEITLRPVSEWFVIRNIRNMIEILKKSVDLCSLETPAPYKNLDEYIGAFLQKKWVAPDFSSEYDQFWLFLIEPPYPKDKIFNGTIDPSDDKVKEHYKPYATNWSANPRLIVNYVQLDNLERTFFAQNCPSYIINQVFETEYYNLFGSNTINTNSLGLLKCWQWFFRRSDVNLRNEWNNYTNFDYENKSNDINTPLLKFVNLLKEKIVEAGNLTNLIENDPLTFARIYYYAIISPIYIDNFPLISLFNPPFLFGYGEGNFKIADKDAFEFHAKVNEINGKSYDFANDWSLMQRGAIYNCINIITPSSLSGVQENEIIKVEFFESIFLQEEFDIICNQKTYKIYGLLELNNLIPIPVLELKKMPIFYDFFGVIDYLIVIESDEYCNSVINIYKKKSNEEYIVPYDNPKMREFLIPVYEKVYCHCTQEICESSNIEFFKTRLNDNIMFVIDSTKILLSTDNGENWQFYEFESSFPNIQDIKPDDTLNNIFIVNLEDKILNTNLFKYNDSDGVQSWELNTEIAKLSYSNYDTFGRVKLLVSYDNNLMLVSKKDIRFINKSIKSNPNPEISNVTLDNRSAKNYYFGVNSFSDIFKSNNLIIDNIAYNNESKLIYLLIKDLENLKYSILVSIDYGQSFKIFNLYNDNEKEIYKLFLIDSDENIDYFETNFNGDVLLIRGKNIFDKYLNILNNKISLEPNIHYDLKFINKKANRNLVPLSKEPFFVYYSDNRAFDLSLFNKLKEYIISSYNNNNYIQSILTELIVISEDLYKNPTNDKFILLSQYLKEVLNSLIEFASKSYLENILYTLLEEREPVIRDYNSLLEQIEEFKKKNVENFQLISRVVVDMKNVNLKNFYKDIVTTILSLRTNNLFLKDIIVQVNIEIFLKLNISSIISDLYKIFVENVEIFNSNMQEFDRQLQNYFLLTEYFSKEEIDEHIKINSQYTTNIIKNIEFITRKSGGNSPVIISFASDRTFFQNINKVKSAVTRNLNFNTKVFNGTAYQNLFKNVFSIPNKYMKDLPVISSRDFMYTSPLFWQVGDMDFPQRLSDLLVYDDSSYPPEWNKLKDTDLKWKGYGNSNLEDYCINNNFKKIYDFSGGDKIPDWEFKIDEADYWIEERDANGIYEEILSKWNLIESSILQQEKSCVATGIIDDLSITKSQPQKLKDIMIDWGFDVDTEVRENTRSQIIAKYVDTYSNGENAITKDGLYFYNFALNSSIYKSQPSGSFNSSFFTRIDWNFKVLNPDYRLNELPISVVCTENNPNIETQAKNPNLTLTEVYRNFEYTYTLKIMEERYNILTTRDGVGRLVLSN